MTENYDILWKKVEIIKSTNGLDVSTKFLQDKKVTGIRTVINGGYETIINPVVLENWKVNLSSTASLYNNTITNGRFSIVTPNSTNQNTVTGNLTLE